MGAEDALRQETAEGSMEGNIGGGQNVGLDETQSRQRDSQNLSGGEANKLYGNEDIPKCDGDGKLAIDPAPPVEIKLFVGRVPRSWEAEQLKPVFEPFGEVMELVIIRDKATKQHKGSAFVRMASIYQADAAIRDLNGKKTLDQSVGIMQVKYAQGELARLGLDSLGESAASSSVKLFVGSIPRNINEQKIRELFENYGQVEEVHILRNKMTNESKGCCFVKMRYKEQALYAMQKLDGEYTMETCIRPLEVRFAHNRELGVGMNQAPVVPGAIPQRGHWREYFTTDGRPYYHNEMTNQTTWDRPPEFNLIPQGPPMTKPRLDIQALAASNATGPPGSNLFIFHVPNEWKHIDLVDTFSQCGPLVAARIATDKNSKMNKGYAFVSYETRDAAQLAVQQFNGFVAYGKRLKVSLKKGDDHYTRSPSKNSIDDKKTTQTLAQGQTQKTGAFPTTKSQTASGTMPDSNAEFNQQTNYSRPLPHHQYSQMQNSLIGMSNPSGIYAPSTHLQIGSHAADQLGQSSHQSHLSHSAQYSPAQIQSYGTNVDSANTASYYTTSNLTSSNLATPTTQSTYPQMTNMGLPTVPQSSNPYSTQRTGNVSAYDTAVHSTTTSTAAATPSTAQTPAVPASYSAQYSNTSYTPYRVGANINPYQNYSQNPYAASIQPTAANYAQTSAQIIPNSSASTAYNQNYHPTIAPYNANPRADAQNYDKDRLKERNDASRKYSPY